MHPGKDRIILAAFIALQYVRTPVKLRENELMYDFGSKMMMRGQLRTDEGIRQAIKSAGLDDKPEMFENIKDISSHLHDYEIMPAKGQLLIQMLKSVPELAGWIMRRRWSTLVFDQPSILTCDSPVLLMRDERIPGIYGRGVGFANAKEILFPLGAKRVLVLHYSLARERLIYGSTEDAIRINTAILDSSYEEIYSHPSLTSIYSGQALGDRPIMTIDSQSDNDLIETYNKPPTRKWPKRRG